MPPTFEVRDAAGNAISGALVTVAISAGNGTLTNTSTSTRVGPTPVGTWKLGNAAGVNSVTVTAGSLPPLVISVIGKPGPPASIVFITGANQTSLAGTALPVAPSVQVGDQFGNGVGGVPVTFSVADGGGEISSTPVTTDNSGNATSPAWRLGRSVIPQTLRAGIPGNITATLSATVASNYNIDVRFFGPVMPPLVAAMFTTAAARIRAAVVGDVPDVPLSIPALDIERGCGNVAGLPTSFSEPIDDIIVYASVGSIDGPGRILAFAGPCYIRDLVGPPGSGLTTIGLMKIDVNDLDGLVAKGNLTEVIEHEMLHMVGVGTLWKLFGILADAETDKTHFTGVLGIGACLKLGGTRVCPGGVPVEYEGGAGTADSHWRESTFDSELMTGFAEDPSAPGYSGMPFSIISIQSLADLGYTVNPAAADPYIVPGLLTSGNLRAQMNAGTSAPWEVVVMPRYEVSRTGKTSAIPPQ